MKTLLFFTLIGVLATSGLAHKRALLQEAPVLPPVEALPPPVPEPTEPVPPPVTEPEPTPAAEGANPSIVDVARTAGLTTLVSAIEAANLTEQLSAPDARYTVFAPTDEAFTQALPVLGLSSADELLASPSLSEILFNHLNNYPLDVDNLLFYGNITTLYGEALTFTSADGVTTVNATAGGGNIITPNVRAAQESYVHVVDGVLLPTL